MINTVGWHFALIGMKPPEITKRMYMLNILVIDDDLDLLQMVTLTLNSNDMHAEGISDDRLLTDSITLNKPDVILMDVCMPNADGRRLCLQLKQSKKFQNIPVILYSALPLTGESIQESMADGFVGKPFDTLQLINLIKSKVENRA